MNKSKPRLRIGRMFILILLMMSMINPGRVLADDDPKREQIIEVTFTEYTWWLLDWQDASLVCEVGVDHPDQPTGAEIYDQCGRFVYYRWFQTEPCDAFTGDNPQDCSGLYLLSVGSEEVTKEITVDLPVPVIRIDLNDCQPIDGTDLCANLPSLLISAEEPLPNERITQIQGNFDGTPFSCLGQDCELVLEATEDRGVLLEFWAESSFGDISDHFVGRIRVSKQTDEILLVTGWRVEAVGRLAELNNMKGCAGIWQSFPPLVSVPDWLQDPPYAFMLKTSEPYALLAGQMIKRGYVDASHCGNYGLTNDGHASQCGLEASRELVYLWQNIFDRFILQSAKETGIPSGLLKRIFAKESQFWPETTAKLYREYGFGHTTELGADTTLLWNREFYDQFCPLMLEVGKCHLGYSQLDDYSQALLRGALLAEMEISLPYDYSDTDFEQIEESVFLFSETLLGNCSQVGQMISYRLDQVPGEISSYEDLWRFTLVNYHGGSGCMANAINQVHRQKQDLTWGNVAVYLGENCPWVLEYVYDVTD